MTGALWAAVSGIGFGLFQSLNRRAVRDIEDPYASTFIQLAIAAVVLVCVTLAAGEESALAGATAWGVIAFALAGIVHFLGGWTFLNVSQARGRRLNLADALPGLGAAVMWGTSPVLTVEGLKGIHSPLAGVSIGMLAAVSAYAAALMVRGTGLGLAALDRDALSFKSAAAVLVALATWLRWVALDHASVGVVLALSLLSVPVVLFVAPLLVGRHLEHVTARVWLGSALVVGGALGLIAQG